MFWVLKGKLAVPIRDVLEWGRSFEGSHRIVAQTYFDNAEPWLQRDKIRHRDANTSRARLGLSSRPDYEPYSAAKQIMVSTVFLGINLRFLDDGDPLLFETLVFNGPCNDEGDRYSTWVEAEEGHEQFCTKVKLALIAERVK